MREPAHWMTFFHVYLEGDRGRERERNIYKVIAVTNVFFQTLLCVYQILNSTYDETYFCIIKSWLKWPGLAAEIIQQKNIEEYFMQQSQEQEKVTAVGYLHYLVTE